MKKIFKTILIFIIGFVLISFINIKGNATLIETIKGASIRTEGTQGLRFYSKLDESVKDNEHGFYLIFGETSVLELQQAINNANDGTLTLNEKKVFKTTVSSVKKDNTFSVVLTGIPEVGYLDKISVIPYVVIGESIEFSEPINRSIGEVALKMEKEGKTPPKNILNLLSVVSFDSNNEQSLIEVIVFKNNKVKRPKEPTKEGYTFLGWYLDEKKWAFAGDKVTEDIKLVAKWELTDGFLEVTYVLNNEEDNVTKAYLPSSIITAPTNITHGKRVLTGWFLTPDFLNGKWDFTNDLVNKNITLYARWSKAFTTVAEYTDTLATINMRGDENNASRINLDSDIFNVVSIKNNYNHVGLNNSGYMRIYRPTNGSYNTLKISIHESFYISNIEISFGNEKGKTKIVLGSIEEILESYGNIYQRSNLEITSFEITNIETSSNNRTDINSMNITYIQTGKDPIKEEDVNSPIINLDEENTLVELVVGNSFNPPTLTAFDVEDGEVDVNVDPTTLPNTNKAGIYYVFYSAIDSDNHETTAYITVIVRDEVISRDSTYYQDTFNKTGNELKTSLKNILNNSINRKSYNFAREALEIADRDPYNFDNVLLIYDRDSDKGPWDHPIWEREHVWPNSMLGVPSIGGSTTNIASDLHNLRAIRPHVNQTRSNYHFVEPNNSGDSFGVVGNSTYYPGNDDKGDVARILFYINTLYDLPIREDINMLLDWHLEDPVDNFEIIRNEVIFGYQGNRNPYIDIEEFALEVYGTVETSTGEILTFKIIVPVTDLVSINQRKTF